MSPFRDESQLIGPSESSLLEGLTDSQRQAVIHKDGPALVLAGPGSGKTRVITRRLVWLLGQGVPAHQVLAITFTNKAAGEMRARVEALLPDSRLQVSTFHSFGVKFLRQHAERAGIDKGFLIYDQSDRLRVVLATTHIALREVPAAVTREALLQAAYATREGLRRDFGIAEPRLALCALNPHAGDSGRFGHEDDDLLAPVARESGMAGPYPADTVFVRAMRGEFDAVIAPYHDVGMTAIKVASFGHAVNVTLGLPFVRTSPDHGTALDIAGQGVASAESLVAAMQLAVDMVERRRAR